MSRITFSLFFIFIFSTLSNISLATETLGKRTSNESAPLKKRPKVEEPAVTIDFEIIDCKRRAILKAANNEALKREIEALRSWTIARGETPPEMPSIDESVLEIDVLPFTPEIVQWSYGLCTWVPGPNCFGIVLYDVKAIFGIRYCDLAEFDEYLHRDFKRVDKPKSGDIGVIYNTQNDSLEHAFIFISENLIYQKRGFSLEQFSLHPLRKTLEFYESGHFELRYYHCPVFNIEKQYDRRYLDTLITKYVIGIDSVFSPQNMDFRQDTILSPGNMDFGFDPSRGEMISYDKQIDFISFISNYRDLENCIGTIEVNRPNLAGDSYLHWAITHEDKDKVKLLLQHGADVFAKNDKGYDALHWAIIHDKLLIGLDISPYYRR